MTFDAPGALLWLALVPVVLLLHMLRARREVRTVPSTLLWERAARDLSSRIPVRRLERSLLLLLQLLAISAVALALARPHVSLPAAAGGSIAIVVDTTASMRATDVAPSRLDQAKREALTLLEGLGRGRPVALISSGARPVVVVDLTADHGAVAAAIGRLRPQDSWGEIDAGVTLALALRHSGRPPAVHVFGDAPPTSPAAVWHSIGRGGENAAVSSVQQRRDARGGTRLLARLEAFGASPQQRVAVVSVNGAEVERRGVELIPGTSSVIVSALGDASGIATVSLEPGDLLASDDLAVAAVGRAGFPRVMVVGGPNAVLDAALGAVPTGGVSRADEPRPQEWSGFDLVVLDRAPLAELPPGAYLIMGSVPANFPLRVRGIAREQEFRTSSATHPVTRLVDLRGVRVAEALDLEVRGGQVLGAAAVPLLWAYEGRGTRAVLLPFGLAQSDLALHPAFPILIANSMEWLAGGLRVSPGGSVVTLAGGLREASLKRPDGAVVAVAARAGLFELPDLDRVGVYVLTTPRWQRAWVVSAVDSRESSLAVRPPQARAEEGGPRRRAPLPISPWLLLAGAAIVCGEWWMWARTVPVAPVAPPRRRGSAIGGGR